MIKVGGAVVGFWFLRGTEQLAHTSQTLKKLAAARDWQEALEIQNSFLRDGLSRLNDGDVPLRRRGRQDSGPFARGAHRRVRQRQRIHADLSLCHRLAVPASARWRTPCD